MCAIGSTWTIIAPPLSLHFSRASLELFIISAATMRWRTSTLLELFSIDLANHTASFHSCPTDLATIAGTRSTLHLHTANWIGNRAAVSNKASTRPFSGTSRIPPGGNRFSNEPADIELQRRSP